MGDLFTLTYMPWGNAKVLSDGKFECQHGEMECVMNTVHACVLFYYPKRCVCVCVRACVCVCVCVMDHPLLPRDDFWPFLHCAFTHGDKQTPSVAQKCAGLASMDWDRIDTCYQGSQGYNLELMYAKETGSLDPPHTYVPWVTLNGKVGTHHLGTTPSACFGATALQPSDLPG